MSTTTLSPEAKKLQMASEMKRRSFWPKLARIGNKLILTHPHRSNSKTRSSLASYVAKELPEFKWNSRECRWEAPLSKGLLAKTLDAFTQIGEIQLRYSSNLTADDIVILIVEYEASPRYLRSVGRIIGVQRNGDEPRPPKNHISPDDAGRHLETNGYQFIEAESAWLDRLGTTVRPRRKQVFRRPAILTT